MIARSNAHLQLHSPKEELENLIEKPSNDNSNEHSNVQSNSQSIVKRHVIKRVRFNLPAIKQSIRYTPHRASKALVCLSFVAFFAFVLLYASTLDHQNNQSNVAFNECINSFQNRDHPLNDGVSLKIGLFSVWDRVDERNRARQSIKQWIPPPLNFTQHCQIYADNHQSSSDSSKQHDFKSIKRTITQFASPSICGSEVVLSFDWLSVYDNIEFVFVIGRPPDQSIRAKVEQSVNQENDQFHDIDYLTDCDENMNDGKSLFWFREQAQLNQQLIDRSADQSTLQTSHDYPSDYIMKLDADSYLHVPNLVDAARRWRAARLSEVYYGFAKHTPHERPPVVAPDQLTPYHSGMGYLLGADLARWTLTQEAQSVIESTIGEGTRAAPNTKGAGHEDLNWGLWLTARGHRLDRHQQAKYHLGSGSPQIAHQLFPCLIDNFINGQPDFYTYPGKATWASISQFRNSTVLVHELKDTNWFHRTVKHFMCNQPQVFDWTNNQFWRAERSWYHAWYLFYPDGSLQEFRDWWNGFGQSYREDWIANHSTSVT